MKQAHPGYSLRRICKVAGVSRSTLGPSRVGGRRRRETDTELEQKVQLLIQEHPTYGYRRLWALPRFRLRLKVNRKRIYRLLKRKRWPVHQRTVTPRPRVQGWTSRTQRSNRRWAMDLTHVFCGRDGWAHLVGVIDCCDRELVGWEFALRGRAKEAERAIEAACIRRFGTLRPAGSAPIERGDDGMIFQRYYPR